MMYEKILNSSSPIIPDDWLQIKTIDLHTGGEPLRVVLSGFPELVGDTVLERRRYCQEHYDHLRTALMFEPRGHADMYGTILTPPNEPDGDFGMIFFHNEGYSTMCGHAVIAIGTLAAQMGWISNTDGEHHIKIDAPCGRINAFTSIVDWRVQEVRFHCVPSFVIGLDKTVTIKGLGEITYDLSYGGAFYAYVDLSKNPQIVDLDKSNVDTIIHQAMQIKRAVISSDNSIIHPFEEELCSLYGTIFIDPKPTASADNMNVCVFADGEVDRSPTGSGVSGRMAIHYARQELALNQSMSIESITGSIFHGKIISETNYGPHTAVIPEVTGTAHITGEHTFIIDPNDPMRVGFLVR